MHADPSGTSTASADVPITYQGRATNAGTSLTLAGNYQDNYAGPGGGGAGSGPFTATVTNGTATTTSPAPAGQGAAGAQGRAAGDVQALEGQGLAQATAAGQKAGATGPPLVLSDLARMGGALGKGVLHGFFVDGLVGSLQSGYEIGKYLARNTPLIGFPGFASVTMGDAYDYLTGDFHGIAADRQAQAIQQAAQALQQASPYAVAVAQDLRDIFSDPRLSQLALAGNFDGLAAALHVKQLRPETEQVLTMANAVVTRLVNALRDQLQGMSLEEQTYLVGRIYGFVLYQVVEAVLTDGLVTAAKAGLKGERGAKWLAKIREVPGLGKVFAEGTEAAVALEKANAELKLAGQFCFAAGTPLLVPGGSRPIEEFRVGDLVLSRPEDDPEAPAVPRRVRAAFANFAPLLELHVGGRTIRTTAEHPFWVLGRGWVAAHQLRAGDGLVGADGRPAVLGGMVGPVQAEPVYNLEVEGYHTYFVGCQQWGFSVWAHNLSCAEVEAFAGKFAKEAQANGGKVPRGVWDRIGGGNLSEADKSAIRAHITANPDKFPGVNIKPRGMGGPLGNPPTRTLDADIAGHLKGNGWTLERGAGSPRTQEWIPGSGPGRTGGTAVDVTVSRVVDGQVQRVRVQTVTTLADGKTPTLVEEAAAARIRAAHPNDRLILVPKGASPSVWQALLAGL